MMSVKHRVSLIYPIICKGFQQGGDSNGLSEGRLVPRYLPVDSRRLQKINLDPRAQAHRLRNLTISDVYEVSKIIKTYD